MQTKKSYKTMFCKCGCGNGIIIKADDDKDWGVSLQLVSDNFYTNQKNIHTMIKEKWKRLWSVLRNKEYCYFDILIEPSELKEFKEFVMRL